MISLCAKTFTRRVGGVEVVPVDFQVELFIVRVHDELGERAVLCELVARGAHIGKSESISESPNNERKRGACGVAIGYSGYSPPVPRTKPENGHPLGTHAHAPTAFP